MASRPTLTEPGVKYFLGETLKNCKKNKDIFNVQLFNLALFVGFLCIVSALLVYKYKTKPNSEELKKKALLKRDYFITTRHFLTFIVFEYDPLVNKVYSTEFL